MRRWQNWFGGACVAVLALAGTAAQAQPPCDEFDPGGPMRAVRVHLGPSDSVDESIDELRTFVATDSIGRVEVDVISASPANAVLRVAAVPQISGFSPYYGERLKGIGIKVALAGGGRPASVVLDVRQVCARYFRNTFLYY
jgi:hypothetical protein